MSLYKIRTNYSPPQGEEEYFEMYLRTIEKRLLSLVPYEKDTPDFFSYFDDKIPLIMHSSLDNEKTSIFSISSIIPAKMTLGAGSYISETFSRWLVPGKQLSIVKGNSTVFVFESVPDTPYFLHQIYLKITNQNEIPIIKRQFPLLADQIKINTSIVKHARSVVASRSLTPAEKKALINTNINSLIHTDQNSSKKSIFEEVNQLITPFSAEEKTKKIQKNLHWLSENKPLIFERDLFTELKTLLLLLSDNFIANRGHKKTTKILSYIYLFRKFLLEKRKNQPDIRHTIVKIFNFSGEKKVVGILVCLNFLNKSELFDEKHLLKSIQAVVPSYNVVGDSLFIDTRDNHHVKTLYIEIDVSSSKSTVSLIIKSLRSKLLKEIKNNIQMLHQSLFNPHNEEELFKNTVILSQQLRYVNDIPQVMINFRSQSNHYISFSVLLARIIKKNAKPVGEHFASLDPNIEIQRHKKKTLGTVRKKHPKEFHSFEILLPKKQFIRKDFSLDIIKARSFVYKQLCLAFGDIRDYNGSLIHQKNEMVKIIKKELKEKKLTNEILIDHFFYNMEPHYIGHIVPRRIIQYALITINDLIEKTVIDKIHIQKHQENNYTMIFILQPINKHTHTQKKPSSNLSSSIAYSSFTLYEISINCFIFSDCSQEKRQQLTDAVYKAYA